MGAPTPHPTVVVLSYDMEDGLNQPGSALVGRFLHSQGWLVVSLYLPGHGREVQGSERLIGGLATWRNRIAAGTNVMARDPRIAAVAALAPVTDLLALKEFNSRKSDPLVAQLRADRLAPQLGGKPLWITINSNDRRVSTMSCLSCVAAVRLAAATSGLPDTIALHVSRANGHSVSAAAQAAAAAWLQQQALPDALP